MADFDNHKLLLSVNGISSHQNDRVGFGVDENDREWNENNSGLGLIARRVKNRMMHDIMFGQYKNSLGNNSIYGAYGLKKRLFGDNKGFHLDGGITAGLVSGYDLPISPMLLPTLSVGNENIDFNVRYQPHIPGITPEVYMMNMDYRLK